MNALLYMIAVDRKSFSVVEDKRFRNLLNGTSIHYTMSKNCRKRIDEKYELLSLKIKIMLSKVDYLCLTIDIWTEPFNTRSYIGVTAHYINFEAIQMSISENKRTRKKPQRRIYINNYKRDIK